MKHVVEYDDIIIPTLEIERICNQINHWVTNLRTGASITGKYRAGKTSSLQFIKTHVVKVFGHNIPCVLLSMWGKGTDMDSANSFWFELLRLMKHAEAGEGNTNEKRIRLIDFMIEKMDESRGKRFLLLVDEAQNLDTMHLDLLKHIQDQLHLEKYNLFIVLVGQPQLKNKKEELFRIDRGDLVDRLLLANTEFCGPQKLKDIKYCCAQYDRIRWPSSTSPTLTQNFLPLAFDNGWRLENVADRLWTMIIATLTDYGITEIKEIPIAPIYAIIRALLTQGRNLDCADFELSNQMLEDILSEYGVEQIVEHTFAYLEHESVAA